jgi:hypothetical protein
MMLILTILGGAWFLGAALFVGGLMLAAKRPMATPEAEVLSWKQAA